MVSGLRRGLPTRPATGGMASTRSWAALMSGTFPAVVRIARRMPAESQAMWCLEPGRPRSTGDGPVPAPPFGPDMGAVETDRGPVDLSERVQLREQHSVKAVPDSGLAPAAESPPAGDT